MGSMRGKLCLAAGFTVVIAIAIVAMSSGQHATAQPEMSGVKYTIGMRQQNDTFSQNLDRISAEYPDLELSIVTTTNQPSRFHYGTKQSYEAASTAKLVTAAAYLDMVSSGKLSLQAPIEGNSLIYWMRQMVIDSDDDAWNVLNSHLTHSKLNAYAASVGMRHYEADSNSMTADDMATFMHRLAAHNLLDEKRTILLESLMQKANYREYIVAGTPQGYTVAHKVGLTAEYLHDTAIIERGDQWLTLVIFTKDTGNYSAQDKQHVMQAITKAAIDAYF
jgi:beta-lactamase class A